MRYLYHLSDGNKGPVTFEQLQALAKAGTIDNMTPVLAEGAREWSRWLFIKDAPQGVPTPAPQAIKAEIATAPAATPNRPATPQPAPQPQKKQDPAPLPEAGKQESKPETRSASAPAQTPAAPPAQTEKPHPSPAAEATSETPAAPTKNKLKLPKLPRIILPFWGGLDAVKLIPAAICAPVTLLALITAVVWSFVAHDTSNQYAALRDMAAEHDQQRPDIEALRAQRQAAEAEKVKINEEITALQHTLQLTLEEDKRLSKGPYISAEDAKTLKEEQARAAKLREQDPKH